MDKKFRNLIKGTIITLFLGVLAVSSTVLAARSRGDNIGRETRTSEKDMQKEKMRQEATQSFPELSDALKGILEKVTKNQRPQPEAVEQARQLLDDNKRNGRAYDDKQKAQFMLLQAWTGFCQDNPVDAVRWSMRACKTNEASQDAWISQALFCVLNDKRPMKPRQEKPRPQSRPQSRRRPRRNVDETESAAKPKPFSEKGVLEFDLMGLRDQVFRQQFGRLKFQATDHSEIEFTPNGETLCVLFWQDDNKPEDAVDDLEKVGREQDEITPFDGMMGMEMGPSAVRSSDSAKSDLTAQRKYFQILMEACKDTTEVKFIQMNTTRPGNPEEFLNELPDYSDEPIPTVVAAQSNSGAEQFVGWKAEKPFIMIVGAEGKVKYAGTAADFVPAFILTELTGVEIDLEKQNQPAAPSQMDMPMMPDGMPGMMPPEMMMPGMMPHLPTPPQVAKTVMDPNGVVNDPNTLTTVQPTQQIKTPELPKGPAKLAMPLRGLTWIRGKPVKFQPGEVYVVEFWATWCPPCKKSIPHLTKIQQKYKDKGVTVIGITNETELDKVKQFVAEQGDAMDYTVAIDKNGKVNAAYMKAYRQNGIPAAFVVDGTGRVVWYGHPMGELDAVLEHLTSRSPDVEGIMNSPNTPVNPERPAPPSPVTERSSDFPTQSLEDQLRAENLLRSAQMHIEESRKLRMKNPKQGIEDARQVLKEFPNTESAQKARELLRRVPSRWKERHGITDEELGV